MAALLSAPPPISIVPLGAGQDVGRSCVLVTVGGRNVMFDCGMHMGYNDSRRFPDFGYLSQSGPLTDLLDAVIISHFHLDHCGALPYFSEMRGYDGPIYMTQPTKAICPILLEDYRKITVERRGEDQRNFFTSQMIRDCMRKVVTVGLHETVDAGGGLEITAYYAGHVLGAAMFRVRVGEQSVVYTGDYNMTPDRHLGAAWIDRCRPDVLITESTYATTIRDSKRCRERNFLSKVHGAIKRNGKVLIPVFALGRAQELCILLETYWERNSIEAPIYFAAGLTEKANQYYKLFIPWTNQKIKDTFVRRNMFDFKHIKPFDRALTEQPGPMVLFATPGMLHAGLSLHVFCSWAPDPNNMVIMPGYCVAGTVGAKVLAGAKRIEIDSSTTIPVRLAVEHLSFSAHADAKGIMQLIRNADARAVVLVHGERKKMSFLKGKIEQEFGIECHYPANGQLLEIRTRTRRPLAVSSTLLKRTAPQPLTANLADLHARRQPIEGVLVTAPPGHGARTRLVARSEAAASLGLQHHALRMRAQVQPHPDAVTDGLLHVRAAHLLTWLRGQCSRETASLLKASVSGVAARSVALELLETPASSSHKPSSDKVSCSWLYEDDALASELMGALTCYSSVINEAAG